MEPLSNYSIRGYNFTLWFFRIIAVMFIVAASLVFLLRINETVTIKEGEIVSSNPQSDYKAPFEAQIVKILCKRRRMQ